MKKLLVALLVVALVVTSAVVVNAKPDKPARPEKLDQVVLVLPVGLDRPGKPDKPPGKPPKEEEPKKDNTYYELWGGYLDGTAEYKINPDVNLVTEGDPIAAVTDAAEAWDAVVTAATLFNYAGTTEESWYTQDD